MLRHKKEPNFKYLINWIIVHSQKRDERFYKTE